MELGSVLSSLSKTFISLECRESVNKFLVYLCLSLIFIFFITVSISSGPAVYCVHMDSCTCTEPR